jgi:hypothetical protein
VDLGPHPTYVILDSGCTRAMGFRFAIDRLVQACQQHPNRDQFRFSKQPCQSKFSSATGEQSTVKERLVIHFHNDHAHTGWITTCVDILDKGKVPILFLVVQMRNLRIDIEHTPVGEFLTCPFFEMQRTAPTVSTSNHPVLDIMALATSTWRPMHSFQSEDMTLHDQHVTVSIVRIPTKKVARNSRVLHQNLRMSRRRPRQFQRKTPRNQFHLILI